MSIFQEIEKLKIQGFWLDELRMERLMIESHVCQVCRKPLNYQGLSNATEHRAYGVCEPCGFARYFWTEGAGFFAFKKRIEKQVAAVTAVN